MKRQRRPWILAGSALGVLMASAPLGAAPLSGDSLRDAVERSAPLPLMRVQAECPEGVSAEECAQGQPQGRPERKIRRKDNGGEAGPAKGEDAGERRRERRQPQRQEAAPPEEAAPAPEQERAPAPAEPKAPAPKRKAPAEAERPKAEPEQAAPQAKPERKLRKQRRDEQAEPAPSKGEQPAGEAAEPGSDRNKLRDYLKKKQGNDNAAPAKEKPVEEKPAEKAAPAEESAPKPEPNPEAKPAENAQPPARDNDSGGQAAEPQSRKDKLRDYLRKKQGGEAAPAQERRPEGEAKPAEGGQQTEQAPAQEGQPPADRNAEETAPAGGQAEGAGEATRPQLPADTSEQALPKGTPDARPLPENVAPLPDSAKKAGERAGQRNGEPRRAERRDRDRRRNGEAEAIPRSDSAAQDAIGKIGKIESVEAVRGKRIDTDRWRDERRKRREEWREREGGKVVKEVDNRVVVKFGDNIYVDRRGANARLERHARDSYVEELPNHFTRHTIVRDNGVRVVTIRNADGDIVRRSRIMPDHREAVLYYVPETYYDRIRGGYYDAGADLPPLQLDIPADEYILDAETAQPDDYYTYLDAPPVEPVERIYSVDEVVHSARIRDKVRRIDLDTITFDTGSAEIGEDQINKLQALGDAMNRILEQNPAETFLIEGHTDAVGSDESNLILSDERAQTVAEALTNVFEIPPENLTTQGYGEEYLKVNTEGASRENRRVAVRRITPLVAPVASAQ